MYLKKLRWETGNAVTEACLAASLSIRLSSKQLRSEPRSSIAEWTPITDVPNPPDARLQTRATARKICADAERFPLPTSSLFTLHFVTHKQPNRPWKVVRLKSYQHSHNWLFLYCLKACINRICLSHRPGRVSLGASLAATRYVPWVCLFTLLLSVK